MALGKKSSSKLDEIIATYKSIIDDDMRRLKEQNREIVRLSEELRQAKHLIGLYEACIQKGVKIDFPNSTVKGGNADNTGDIDFSDF